MLTERLEVRPTTEDDRATFVSFFTDEAFMEFSGGVLDGPAANAHFDKFLAQAAELSYAKQCVIEQASGQILGYSGMHRCTFEGEQRLEYGYRLIPSARGKGYATEAARALLAQADAEHRSAQAPVEALAIIDPTNLPSQNVAAKLGFAFWKQAIVDGFLDNLYTRQLG